jgi:hypothetical protein
MDGGDAAAIPARCVAMVFTVCAASVRRRSMSGETGWLDWSNIFLPS